MRPLPRRLSSAPPVDRPLGRRGFFGLCAAAAAAGGLSWVHPALFAGAWIWVALSTVILLRSRSRWAAFAGCWAASVLAHAIGFDWVAEMTTISVGYQGAGAVAFAVAQYAAFGLFTAGAIAATSALARGRLPAALWLPPAWLLAEHARFALLAVSIDDWLATQWRVEPVLVVLGHWGWWPAAALCLAACAGIGEALVRRRVRHLLPAVGVAGAMLALPPLPVVGLDQLEGIAAVHVEDDVTLPHRAPPDAALDLIVWPEDAQHLRPILREGQARGVRLQPLLPTSRASHLIGLTTQTGRGAQQNQAVVVDADGRVQYSRAKQVLLPVTERSLLGVVGEDHYLPGRLSPRLRIGEHAVGALICGELLDRALVRQAVAEGARVLLVPARDQMMVSDRALRHLLAMQVLRSVEFGVPSVRAAIGGRAVFIASDGRLLARSARGRNGFLMWDRARGARAVDFFGAPLSDGATGRRPMAERPTPDVVVLYSADAPRFRARCPEGRCRYVPLQGFTCRGEAASTVIVSGHGRPPRYLSHPAEELAAAVRCHRPELVIIDTCYGASAPLLAALSDMPALIVGATSLVPPAGLRYGPAFFGDGPPAERAAAVTLPHGALTRWRASPDDLTRAEAAFDEMTHADLAARVVRRSPMQARMPLPGGHVLLPVETARAERLGPHLARIAARRSRERMRLNRRPALPE